MLLTAISLPLRAADGELRNSLSVTQDAMRYLEQTEKLFWKDLATSAQTGDVPHIRESLVSLALVKSYQTSLGNFDPRSSLMVANLIGKTFFLLYNQDLRN
jgi:separase